MNQRNVLNLALALALAGLVAIALYEPATELPEQTVLLTPLTPTDIHKIVIDQTNQPSTLLTKTNGQWLMSKPYNNQANTLRINKLLDLANTKSHAQYSASNANLKQLKLSAPDLFITLEDTKMAFGTTDALKGYRYIQINNTVHLITDRYSHLIRGQATKLLSPALLPKNSIVTKLVLPDLSLELNDTGWQTKPPDKATSDDQLQQILDEWRFARAHRVSKLVLDGHPRTTDNKSSVIEVHTDKNQTLLFKLIRQKNEIILQRTDTGFSYHFASETGERLLNLPLKNTSPTDDK